MRFLTDQDVYAVTTQLLRRLGHDVVTAKELGLARANDLELLQTARAQERILVTRDRDFGYLVVVQGLGTGVIYLRMAPATVAAVHAELERVLDRYGENALLRTFVVVEPGRHRRRPLPGADTDGEASSGAGRG